MALAPISTIPSVRPILGSNAVARRALPAALALALVAVGACNRSSSATDAAARGEPTASTGAQPSAEEQVVAVTVGDNGFAPNQIQLTKGRTAKLRFTRTTDQTCATEVAFKELGVKKELPLNQPVDVEIPTSEARTIGFTCGMGMYASTVTIK
jgi:uncharacterized cupredoxin-like copper-binding protein